MCRFTAYLGPPVRLSALLTDPTTWPVGEGHSAEDWRDSDSGDGFGIGWYVPEVSSQPGVFRVAAPAWSNENLKSLAAVVSSPCAIAHVRTASEGMPASEANCHPFRNGRLLFVHNGQVGGFSRIRRPLSATLSDESFAMIGGTTDSELVFALFLDRLWARKEAAAHLRLAGALNEVVWTLVQTLAARAPGEGMYLNVALSDGDHVAACRFAWGVAGPPESLYYLTDPLYEPTHRAPPAQRARERSVATVISSQRLTPDQDWVTVPPGHLILADRDLAPLHFEMRPEGLVPAPRPN